MREISQVEEMLLEHPMMTYENDVLYDADDEIVSDNANYIIARHYDDFDSLMPNGEEYISRAFFDDYELAFKNIYIPQL